MTTQDEGRKHRLYTLEEAAEILFGAKASKSVIKELDGMVAAYGTYRLFGQTKYMTEGDMDALLKCIAARHTAEEPDDGTEGHVVFIGDRVDQEALIFMGFAPLGSVDRLVKDVQSFAETTVHFLDAAPVTYGVYREYAKTMVKHRFRGKWFLRSPEMMAFVKSILPKDGTD
jgi:hypothetical protein